MESAAQMKRKLSLNMDCSICLQPYLSNQMAIGDLIDTHCNHILHSNCMERWNNLYHTSAAACPNYRTTELIAFFIDETDNARIIEANTFIPNGSQVQCDLIHSSCQE